MAANTTTSDIMQPTVSAETVELKSRSKGTVLKEYGHTKQSLEIENFDLIAKVKELLHDHKLWGPDGTYTFKDGERWARLDIEE
jgi:hypothetical protein